MILATILAGALAQEASAAKLPDPALFAELIRTTNALPAFAVEYRVTKGGADFPGTIRILYRAPDRTKIVFGDMVIFRIQAGVVDIRPSGAGEKAITARLPTVETNRDRFERVATVVRAEFSACADEWSFPGGAGIRFDLSVQETSNPSEKTLQFTASSTYGESVLLGWLEALSKKPNPLPDGDRLVFEEPDGTKITLSTKTGFIEKVEKPRPEGVSSFAMTSLDLSPELDDSAFDLPAPAGDVTDASGPFAEQMQRIYTKGLRRRALACVAKLVAEKKLEWGPEARGRFAKVLGAIHGTAWTLENEVWVTDMRLRMVEFATWFRDRLRDPELADPEARKKIEESVTDWRQRLTESANSALEPHLSCVSIEPDVIADEAIRMDVLDLEREVVKRTLQTELVDPLLRAFDEKIEEARRKP